MPNYFRREFGLAIAWLVFPLVPVVLADLYYQTCNLALFGVNRGGGPDPYDWDWVRWVIMLGPLTGYGYLAGATLGIPDQPVAGRSLLRRWLARRAMWVAIGPWCGFLLWTGVYFGLVAWDRLIPAGWRLDLQRPAWWTETWAAGILWWILSWLIPVGFVATLAYGWLWPAWAALRRAARVGRWGRAFYGGLVTAVAFVGSLLGSFWAITSVWRSFFFDPRVVPPAALAVGLAVMSGCGAPLTYGDVRRRELFHAMLVAWVLGLAFLWRWWSRRRPGPPPGKTAASD